MSGPDHSDAEPDNTSIPPDPRVKTAGAGNETWLVVDGLPDGKIVIRHEHDRVVLKVNDMETGNVEVEIEIPHEDVPLKLG